MFGTAYLANRIECSQYLIGVVQALSTRGTTEQTYSFRVIQSVQCTYWVHAIRFVKSLLVKLFALVSSGKNCHGQFDKNCLAGKLIQSLGRARLVMVIRYGISGRDVSCIYECNSSFLVFSN